MGTILIFAFYKNIYNPVEILLEKAVIQKMWALLGTGASMCHCAVFVNQVNQPFAEDSIFRNSISNIVIIIIIIIITIIIIIIIIIVIVIVIIISARPRKMDFTDTTELILPLRG